MNGQDAFTLKRRIYYHNTDTGGVVYYGNYLRLMEEALVEYLRHKGVDTADYHNKGVRFATVRVEAEYKSPARYGDTLTIYPMLECVGQSSLTFSIQIERNGTLLVKARVVWVCIGTDIKKSLLPEEIRMNLGSGGAG